MVIIEYKLIKGRDDVIAILYILIIVIIFSIWSLIEPQLIKIKKVNIENKNVNSGIKLVFISDLHYGGYYSSTRLNKIVKKINKMKPDIVIIGGDYLDHGRRSRFNRIMIEELFLELYAIKSKHGVFSVLGNHEYYLKKNIDLLLKSIDECNIKLLKNSTEEITINNDKILIHGVDDIQEGNVDIDKLNIEKDKLNILVSHNPDFFEENDVYFDVGLSGHTHGGQVTFFGLYAPVTESKYGQKYVKTLNKMGTSTIITSRGLGCSMLPIRFFAPPEIVHININKH